MTACDLFDDILDMNESIEYLKSKNNSSTPDLQICKAVTVLTKYRDILIDVASSITIENLEVVVNGRGKSTQCDNKE